MANPKNAAWYGGGLGMFLLPGTNFVDNSLFYIDDTDGLDTNDGLTPTTAFQTITYAQSQAVAAPAINYFIVLRYGNDATLDAVWPIPITVANTQLIAASMGSFIPDVNIVANGAFGCLSIEADGIRVQGFMIRPGAAPGIVFDGEHGNQSIFDCRFDMGTYGIYSAWGGVGWGLDIERCSFVGNLTAGGISLQDDPASIRIHNNVFKCNQDAGQIAIDILNGGDAEITSNQFSIEEDAVTGYAITLQATTNSAFVNNNWAATGVAVPGVNPYRDLGGAVHPNNWGLNYMGVTATYPVAV